MYITGIGRTRFGILDKSFPELLYEAMYRAINDSPIVIEDIDAILVSNFLAGLSQNQHHLGSLIMSLLPGMNLPIYRVEAACASGGVAVHQALLTMKKFKNVLVIGGEKISNVSNSLSTKYISTAGDVYRDQNCGLIFPAQYALIASKYLKIYNGKHDDLALVSLKNHRNSVLNPLSHFRYKDVSLKAIRSSPMVCSPLTLFDCCPISDGASAIVLSDKRKTDRDVKIIGSAVICDAISLSQRTEITSFRATKIASKNAYKMAGVNPNDIDIAEVHDCFTIAELIAMEDLGFCSAGKGLELIRKGETSLTGALPINTDGGLIGNGHPVGTTGISQIYEIVCQLRGEAGKRQIPNARIGLSHNVGGAGGTVAIHIMEMETS